MTDETPSKSKSSGQEKPSSIPDTLQALIVAFVIAMMARGFVLEGFVIPTGSMAPTLLGEHVRWQSPQTGWSYAMDGSATFVAFGRAAQELAKAEKLAKAARTPEQAKRERMQGVRKAAIARWDPMFGLDAPVQSSAPRTMPDKRGGDRVLVLKTLYPFFEPDRFDVVVFKNPTDPVGPTQNFIKRLVGLPSEQLVTVDGDVFTGPLDGPSDQLQIVRKPEFVQRAVWQPVYDSNHQPINLNRWQQESASSWWGAPWSPIEGETSWEIGVDRVWRSTGSGQTTLGYNGEAWPVTDFNMYNIYRGSRPEVSPLKRGAYAVSDLRVAGAIAPDDLGDFNGTSLVMESRGIRFRWSVTPDAVSVSMTSIADGRELGAVSSEFVMPTVAFEVDFWHVDQQMWLFVDGVLRVQLPFDGWTTVERFAASFPGTQLDGYLRNPLRARPEPPTLSWSFDGGSFALSDVRIDRDLYYRPKTLDSDNQYIENGRPITGLGFGTDILNPGRIEADQFLMFGDNSSASRDGRIWGRPHPLAAEYTGDDAPFVVPRRLLIGKAFSVYFPSTLKIIGTDRSYIPDFGELRFIR